MASQKKLFQKKSLAVTFIDHLYMKLLTKHGIATIRSDKMASQECYINFLRKNVTLNVNRVLNDTEMIGASKEGQTSEQREDIKMVDVPERMHEP